MLGRLILLFTVVPLAELFILIKIGSHIGGFNTILLVFMSAMLGALLAHRQGLRTLQQIQLSLSQGQIPAEELIDGVLILVGGILLVTPGVLTDLFALVLLFSAHADILQALAAAPIRPQESGPVMSGSDITAAASEVWLRPW